MVRQDGARAPNGIRRSPTGRVPQWVLGEAAGKPVAAVPFRGGSGGLGITPASPRRSRSRRLGRAIVLTAAAAGIGAGALYLERPVTVLDSNQATTPGPSTAAPAQWEGPPPGFEESPSRLRPASDHAPASEGQGFRFSRHEDDGTPVTWSPCRPIHFVIRPDHAPIAGEQMIKQAFANLGAATGLEFVHDGSTSEGPSEDRRVYQPSVYGDRWAPVLVAWATRSEVPDFGVDIIGEASPLSVRTPSGDSTYISGVVYLDAVKLTGLSSSHGQDDVMAVIQHELGHLVGLAHVDDPSQLMAPQTGQTAHFQAGDRAGLAALGRGRCQPDA